MVNHDKQIMAGLLLDKDKASIKEAINLVSDNTKRLQEAEYNCYLLTKILCAIAKQSMGTIKVPKAMLESISPVDAIEMSKNDLTGDVSIYLKGSNLHL